ncbi:3'-to-5' exoribonuclease RNase R [Candidatus Palibaumannia cicadellinicola]|uniref:Ribonuclease R n=1 Tax=Candidatus Palibaumannia cicadellinicola TaxID=186490 RepID=A0A0K2BM35_9GAMM|nr:3'-to-5' exoribonuclease RNase R [Candidatus Baumannia cicadellinicola]
MERNGQLMCIKKKYYVLKKNLDVLRGTVIGHRDGFGFLRVDGRKEDFYLSAEQMKIAINGDVVIAATTTSKGGYNKGRREARIIRVLVPNTNQIVGHFFRNANKAFVVPEDSRLSFEIIIPQEATHNAHIGCIVVVKLTQRPNRYTNGKAIGKVIEVLGDKMGTSMAVAIALRTYDMPYIWPQAVEQQIAASFKNTYEEVPKSDYSGRIDLRMLPLITIDGEEASDLDDAVYCEKKRLGWRLLVAIADVSYYVRPNTPLDNEARNRATSVYFPSKVIPMLPDVLSNRLCSLNPKVDRLCMVCEMTISAQGRLSSYKFYEAVINSKARLTYNQVWQILQGNKQLSSNYANKIIKPINQLYAMSQKLEQARIQRGCISFETEEAKFIFNAEQRIERIEPMVRNEANKLIEECMILANIAAASFIANNKEPALYRVHDRPSNDNISSLRSVLSELGLTLGGGNKPNPKDYADLISIISDRTDNEMLRTMLLRSMKQAIYDPENRGHFGLALQAYTHFTSPIRRYSDLVLHRSIKYLLGKQKGEVNGSYTTTGGLHSEIQDMLKIGQQCSMSERRADDATRHVADWLKCDFMRDHVGEVFYGIIANVTCFGLFVRINELCIDGLVHVSSLDNDYYRYDNVGKRLIGESFGRIYSIGDAVGIRVEKIHMSERKINFSLISTKRYDYKNNKSKNQQHRAAS